MTNWRKRAGALALAVAMILSTALSSVPALAAETPTTPTTYQKPKLVMDFLGDNKGPTGTPGVPGSGSIQLPKDHDMSVAGGAADGYWEKYVAGDQGTNTPGNETMFWIGIGIQDVDKFVVSNEEKGIYSAEVALYYNPEYVEPYFDPIAKNPGDEGYDAARQSSYQAVVEAANLSTSPNGLNQWDKDDYRVVRALTDQTPLNDPNDTLALGDPTTPSQGYGTQEFGANQLLWRMTYVSIEMTEEALKARLSEASHDEKETYYLVMIPFVLCNHDPDDKLCIRLARNASMFSIGSGMDQGMGQYGDGESSYGNWDKYTYHDPDHDLKLMLEYTGDLNIFTGKKERIDTHWAQLRIEDNTNNPANYAQMIINDEPFAPPPSQLADADKEIISLLSGGEELRVSAHAAADYTVSVWIERTNAAVGEPTITPITAVVSPWTNEWTFVMPDMPDEDDGVIVHVVFTSEAKLDTEYKATLKIIDNNLNVPQNTAKLTAQGAQPAGPIATGTAETKIMATRVVTISVTRNSDYDVIVKWTPDGEASRKPTQVTVLAESLTYIFTMPAKDVEVEVEFRHADTYKATLAVDGAAGLTANWAQLSFTDGGGVAHRSGIVDGQNANDADNPATPGLKHNQIESTATRLIVINTGCDVEYQVKSVEFQYVGGVNNGSAIPGLKATAGTDGVLTFPMPAHDVRVIVHYEKVPVYKVRLVIKDALPGEGVTLRGKDARNGSTNFPDQYHEVTLNKDQYDTLVGAGDVAPTTSADNYVEVFANAKMDVELFYNDIPPATKVSGVNTAARRTATIEVHYPTHPTYIDQIATSGSAGSGFHFDMVALNNTTTQAVYVVVTFKNADTDPLTARIYQEWPSGVTSAQANAVWTALGHNNDIGVYSGDELAVSIDVDAGYYIHSIQVYDGKGPTSNNHAGAPLGVPVQLSGNGYNNGLGGSEQATFTMPNEDATLVVVYKAGPPPEEPDFTATIRREGDGSGEIHIKNETRPAPGGAQDTYAFGQADWVDAQAGDEITAWYKPDTGSYVTGVTVTADVPGTAVSWHFLPDAGGYKYLKIDAMPGANVVVKVEFSEEPGTSPYNLTLEKEDRDTPTATNAVTTTPSGGTAQVSVVTTDTTTAFENELVTLNIDVTAGWYIDAVEIYDSSNTLLTTVPVNLSGNGYDPYGSTTETATFQMPAGDTKVKVIFKDSSVYPPERKVTLVVDAPAGSGNSADLIWNGSLTATPALSQTKAVDPGDTVVITTAPANGYIVDLPILTTPNGLVTLTSIAVNTYEFTMPSQSVTVTVPFVAGSDPIEFYADLIFRDGDGNSAQAVRDSKGSFLFDPYKGNDYKTKLDNGPLEYRRTAVPGEDVPFGVQIPAGYYISKVTVTPADFGVTANITGMIGGGVTTDNGAQKGDFIMPAGNVHVNVYLAKGWPDEAKYQVNLYVEAPNGQQPYPASYSSATLENMETGDTQGIATVPGAGQTAGSDYRIAMDGDKMQVVLKPDSHHIMDSFTVVNGNGDPVSYSWTTVAGELAAEFSVPGSRVDVYVKFREKTAADDDNYDVTLHVSDPDSTGTNVALSGPGGSANSDGAGFPAKGGDDIALNVTNSTAKASTSLITHAYAITKDTQVYVDLGGTLAGKFVDELTNPYGFVMPNFTDVDVYLVLREEPDKPDDNHFMLTLQVKGPGGSGTVDVREYGPAESTAAAKTPIMSATANGGDAASVLKGDQITAQVTLSHPKYALYSIIAYTDAGDRVVVSLDAADNNWRTYIFTMPENTTHIEVEFREVGSATYQIQLVVNNTVDNGRGQNDAWLYPVGDMSPHFKFKTGVVAGTTFDLGLVVQNGYQVDSILAVPQGSGVAANISLPATTGARTQVQMPASNLVIYVNFRLDTTTRYNVRGFIDYPSGVTRPDGASQGSNKLFLTGTTPGQSDDTISNVSTLINDFALIQESQDKRVDVKWECAQGYVVSSYSAKTTNGDTVLVQPNDTNDGFFFYMPAAPVDVRVVFTEPEQKEPDKFTATLHYVYLDGVTGGDTASITDDRDASNTTNTDGGQLSITGKADLNVGTQVNIAAAPGSGRYLQSVYVLQGSPSMTQTGQMLSPLNNNTFNATSGGTADFYMPSGDVHVYACFTNVQPDPLDHMAVVQVSSDDGVVSTTSFAEISSSDSNHVYPTAPKANCNDAPAAIVVRNGSTVSVKVTVDPAYTLVSVTGTPIHLLMQLTSQANADGTTTYTFMMPDEDASIIVNLKKKEAVKYQLNLYVSGCDGTDNATTLAYGSPIADSLVVEGNANPESMQTPGNVEVTLTVEPKTGYFVRAAYVVYNNELVRLKPAELPADYTTNGGKRFDSNNLEGATDIDTTLKTNTATFIMPTGTTNVYVAYEKGSVPTDPWYNLVVIATDTGGATNNTGKNNVNVTGNPAALIPNPDNGDNLAHSDASGNYFFSVTVPTDWNGTDPSPAVVRLNASKDYTDPDYQYDTATGMVMSYQTAGIAANKALEAVETATNPRKDIQEFGMPRGNVGVRLNFVTISKSGLWAQLHVVRNDGVPGYNSNVVTLSTGGAGTAFVQQAVDNHTLVGALANDDTDAPNMTLKDLSAGQTISALCFPRDSGTRVIDVQVTRVDEYGNPLGTSFVPHAGSSTSAANDYYNYIMGEDNVHVYVTLGKDGDDRYVAVAAPVYVDNTIQPADTNGDPKNMITDVSNITNPAFPKAPHWTEIVAKDEVQVDFVAELGVYVMVTAREKGDTTKVLPVGQSGVGNGTAGSAYVQVPDYGVDVEIVVEFSREKPTDPYDLTFQSANHDALADNQSQLDITRPVVAGVRNTIPLNPPAPVPPAAAGTDTFGVTLNATSGDGGVSERVLPGCGLTVSIPSLAAGYSIEKVEVTFHTDIGDVTVPFRMKPDTTNGNKLILVDSTAAANPVNLQMSPSPITITVYFETDSGALRPYDPENAPDANGYKDHWIKAENRGDYLIVTVDMLNKKDGSTPTDVVWDKEVKEDRFKFYLLQDGSNPAAYIDLKDVIELTRPDDAPAAGANDPTEYWLMPDAYSYSVNSQKYDSAKFNLTVKSDDDLTTQAQKDAAAILRSIIDNDGTKKADDKYSLYITCEETTYTDNVANTPKESEKVDFEVPRYYSLIGKLESFAPTHIATFTMESAGVSDPVYVSTLQDADGTDLWRQDFKVKLTSDWDKLDGKSFTLTIEKASHITYIRANIVLDTASGFYDADDLSFSFEYPIQLICGDLDNNGAVKERDVNLFLAIMNGPYEWNTETNKTSVDWANSVYNCESMGYLADLNGDGRLNDRDLNILLDVPSYNLDQSYYGAPTGLGGNQMTLYSMRFYPQWAKDMLQAGRTLPEWVLGMLNDGKEVPAWAVSLIQRETALPDWAVELALAEKTAPDWATFCVMMNVSVPQWATEMLLRGENIPDWAAELVMTGKRVPQWAVDLLWNGRDVPEWAGNLAKTNTAMPDWALTELERGHELPTWAIELAQGGEELPEWAAELVANGEALPDTPEENKVYQVDRDTVVVSVKSEVPAAVSEKAPVETPNVATLEAPAETPDATLGGENQTAPDHGADVPADLPVADVADVVDTPAGDPVAAPEAPEISDGATTDDMTTDMVIPETPDEDINMSGGETDAPAEDDSDATVGDIDMPDDNTAADAQDDGESSDGDDGDGQSASVPADDAAEDIVGKLEEERSSSDEVTDNQPAGEPGVCDDDMGSADMPEAADKEASDFAEIIENEGTTDVTVSADSSENVPAEEID